MNDNNFFDMFGTQKSQLNKICNNPGITIDLSKYSLNPDGM
jgi:hypothetical protein